MLYSRTSLLILLCLFFFFFCFFWATPTSHGSSWVRVKSEVLLPAYNTNTRMQDPGRVFDLYPSSRQHQILNPRSEARDRTHIFMDTSRICFHCTTIGTLCLSILCVIEPFLIPPCGQIRSCLRKVLYSL